MKNFLLFIFLFVYTFTPNGYSNITRQIVANAGYTDIMVPREYEIELYYDDNGNSYVKYLWEIDEHPKFWEFPENINIFGAKNYTNNWTLDSKGQYFELNISEVDYSTSSTGSSSGNSNSETHTIGFNMSIPIFEKAGLNASSHTSYTYSKTLSYNSNMNFKAASVVPIGQLPIDYCDQESQCEDFLFGTILNLNICADIEEKYW